jgi:hypothetical protein
MINLQCRGYVFFFEKNVQKNSKKEKQKKGKKK